MPDDAVYVGRPSRWGNPFVFDDSGHVYSTEGPNWWSCGTRERAQVFAVELYDEWLGYGPGAVIDYPGRGELVALDQRRDRILTDLDELRGKSLACWCGLDEPCHAEVLLDALAFRRPDVGP